MLNIISHQGNAIQNHNMVSLHTYQMFKIKTRLTIPNVGKDMEQLKLSYTAGGNVKNYITNYITVFFGKQFDSVFKMLKYRPTI